MKIAFMKNKLVKLFGPHSFLLFLVVFGLISTSFSQCINPAQIDSTVMCPMNYEPVCGCNGITYSNSCIAQFYGGVTSWIPGECNGNNSCINPSQIDSTAICPTIFEPVCGCDSVTYSNSCVAQFYGGVTSWTLGPCQTQIQFADSCTNLDNIDFGACTLFLGYGLINGICTPISGCGTIIGNIDYANALSSTLDSCQACLFGSVQEIENRIKVFPNTLESYVTIEVGENMVGSQLRLNDAFGKLILTNQIEKVTTTISLEKIYSGVYFLEFTGEKDLIIRLVKP